MRDKSRRVLEIAEVAGYRDGEVALLPLYVFEEKEEEENGGVLGSLVKKGELRHVEKLKAAGIKH